MISTSHLGFYSVEQTYDPSGRLAIHELLGISPLVQEVVRSNEVGGDGPFTEPQGTVSKRSITLNSGKVWNIQALAGAPFQIHSGDGYVLQILVK